MNICFKSCSSTAIIYIKSMCGKSNFFALAFSYWDMFWDLQRILQMFHFHGWNKLCTTSWIGVNNAAFGHVAHMKPESQ